MGRRILVLAAHPDDETIGCGATLARWSTEGAEIVVWFATDGVGARSSPPESVQLRRDASRKALDLLGVSETYFDEFPDNALDTVGRLAICRSVEAVVSRTRPDLIMTHSQADLNIDHRMVGECAAIVSRPTPQQEVESLWHFEVPSSTGWFGNADRGFKPSHYVDIESFLEVKAAALGAYGPEIPAWPHARSIEALAALARTRGSSVGLQVAEAFEVSHTVIRG